MIWSFAIKSCLTFVTCIFDVHIAEKEYIHSIKGANQLCRSDAKDILNILNVSELREIWCISLKKVRINC